MTQEAKPMTEISDAAKAIDAGDYESLCGALAPFILAEPVDPLLLALNAILPAGLDEVTVARLAERLPRTLKTHGLKIVKDDQ